jgi:hypothetical protein
MQIDVLQYGFNNLIVTFATLGESQCFSNSLLPSETFYPENNLKASIA